MIVPTYSLPLCSLLHYCISIIHHTLQKFTTQLWTLATSYLAMPRWHQTADVSLFGGFGTAPEGMAKRLVRSLAVTGNLLLLAMKNGELSLLCIWTTLEAAIRLVLNRDHFHHSLTVGWLYKGLILHTCNIGIIINNKPWNKDHVIILPVLHVMSNCFLTAKMGETWDFSWNVISAENGKHVDFDHCSFVKCFVVFVERCHSSECQVELLEAGSSGFWRVAWWDPGHVKSRGHFPRDLFQQTFLKIDPKLPQGV